ncbi:MAG: hypothetical protein KDC44_01690 [Phaeodactylibacter sp.]|nr:hypothetical protein [Phaeodactylibacter sp.]
MIYTLRQQHFRSWIIITIFLALAFGWTLIRQVPEAPLNTLQVIQPARFSEAYASIGSARSIQVSLRQDGNLPGRQLEINYLEPITAAGIAVHYYTPAQSNSKGVLLGKLSGLGSSRFNIPRDLWEEPHPVIILYDLIKGIEIARYPFENQ